MVDNNNDNCSDGVLLQKMKLSIVIPVYNEKEDILKILEKVENVKLNGIQKEIILVDDFSTDGTRDILRKIKGYKIIYHNRNKGKGAALRTGFRHCTGDVIIIQDADLEYEPNEYGLLLKPILDGKTDVVYGSRFIKKSFKPANKLTYVGNIFLSLVTMLLYFRKITDMETCYKMFRSDVIKNINLKGNGFEIEPEITSKIIKSRHKIIEIPISYHGRDKSHGKKLKPFKDGMKALYYLIKYRFVD